jgi:hypothetical protein
MISHSGRRARAANPEQSKTSKTKVGRYSELEYGVLVSSPRERFEAATCDSAKVFKTDATGLWELYLKGLPAPERQYHNCHCCRTFIERFGSLVVIDDKGIASPALWTEDCAGLYHDAFAAMFHAVKSARVTGVFLCKKTTWGIPETPGWTHLSAFPPARLVYRETALTAGQKMAAKREDYITISRALSEYPAEIIDQAIRLFDADALARSERFLEPARWLRRLHDRPRGRLGENILWREVASAPDGFCHIKSSVIGPLLDAIREGKPFDEIRRSFESMLHPLRYQRPTEAPNAGNIRAAELLVEKLGVSRSLERRFARLDEVPRAWTPKPSKEPSNEGGVFAHVKAKSGGASVRPVEIGETVVTAVKFLDKVLPSAEKIELLVPGHGNFIAMLTAEHADAPVIHKWGNAFSIYVYHNGSPASTWKLAAHAWAEVTAFVRMPSMWGETPSPHLGDGYVIALKGAVDVSENQGNALFPETLIGELHGARSVVEAYSKAAKIGGRENASVCGYALRGGGDVRLRVLANGGTALYRIDRWD